MFKIFQRRQTSENLAATFQRTRETLVQEVEKYARDLSELVEQPDEASLLLRGSRWIKARINRVQSELTQEWAIEENEQGIEDRTGQQTKLKTRERNTLSQISKQNQVPTLLALEAGHHLISLAEAISIAGSFQIFGLGYGVLTLFTIVLWLLFFNLPRWFLSLINGRNKLVVGTVAVIILAALFTYFGILRIQFAEAVGAVKASVPIAGFVILNLLLFGLTVYLVQRKSKLKSLGVSIAKFLGLRRDLSKIRSDFQELESRHRDQMEMLRHYRVLQRQRTIRAMQVENFIKHLRPELQAVFEETISKSLGRLIVTHREQRK